MLPFLEKLQPNNIEENTIRKKILCIIEGDLELRYIVKIFKIFGYEKGCYPLTEECIKVAWGDKFPPHINIVNSTNCTFLGGSSIKGRKVPFPAIDAFEQYEDDLTIFDSIIIFFDGDKDKENEVENYFKEAFKDLALKNSLLVSNPCFESSLIDFCSCNKCREDINNREEGKYPCDKYKNNFSQLNCFSGSKHLISNLNKNNLQTLKTNNSKLNATNQLIQEFMIVYTNYVKISTF